MGHIHFIWKSLEKQPKTEFVSGVYLFFFINRQYCEKKVALFDQVDYEECSLVGYTECTTEETSQDLRDDQVTSRADVKEAAVSNKPYCGSP